MPSLAPSVLLLALLPSLALGAACTDEQSEYSYGIYESAATTVGCASLSTISDAGVDISYKCSDTSCLVVLRQLEYQLPDCENQNGVNLKYNLQQNLYENCNLCSYDESDTVTSLYKATAQSDACAEYSYVSSTYVSITWPCSATDCSAVIADMAEQLPSCIEAGENVKTYAQNLDCFSSNDVDETEAPSSDTIDISTDTTTPEPTATEEPIDITSVTSSASSDYSTPEPSYDDYTYAPTTTSEASSASYSSDSCSTSEVSDMASLYYDTATSSACDLYSSVTSLGSYYYIYIYTPCTSTCASSLRGLDDALPDCYYDYEIRNKKEELAKALEVCDSRRRLSVGRQLKQEASSYDHVSITMYVKGDAPGQTSGDAGDSNQPNSSPHSVISVVVALLAGIVALLCV